MLIYVLLGIFGLFFLVLLVKSMLKNKKICAICFSVSLTWIILLSFYFLGFFTDKTIIAILMGMTALGIYYLAEKKVSKKLTIFRLPLLLTFIFIIYSVLESFNFNSFYFLISLWVIFTLIYLFKSNKNFSVFANKLIECCRNW